MTRFGITVYLLLLVLLALLSVPATAALGNPVLLLVEGGVDLVLVAGVFLYLRGVRWRGWRLFLLPALVGEVGLLLGVGETAPGDFVVMALILAPALYLNARVASPGAPSNGSS
jgi:hypothetical protein